MLRGQCLSHYFFRPLTRLFVALVFLYTLSGLATQPPEVLQAQINRDRSAVVLSDFNARLIVDNLESLYWKQWIIDRADEVALSTFEWEDDFSGLTIAYGLVKKALAKVERDPATSILPWQMKQISLSAAIQSRETPPLSVSSGRAPVRVFIDGFDIISKGQLRMLAAMHWAGVEVKVYRPPRDHRWPKLLHYLPKMAQAPFTIWNRMHDKALWARITDAQGNSQNIFVTGGRNTSDHYLLGTDVFDVDVMLSLSTDEGEQVYRRQFETFERTPVVEDFHPENYPELSHFSRDDFMVEVNRMHTASEYVAWLFKERKTELRAFANIASRVKSGVYLRNFGSKASLTLAVEDLISRAEKSVTMANAYFIPHQGFNELLMRKLKKEGVDVAVYTNSPTSTRHTNVVHLMESMISGLLPEGLQLYLSQEGEVHAKTTAVDHTYIVVGAANLDPRSSGTADPGHMNRDTQNGVLMYSPELAHQFEMLTESRRGRGGFRFLQKFPKYRPLDTCARLLLAPIRGWF